MKNLSVYCLFGLSFLLLSSCAVNNATQNVSDNVYNEDLSGLRKSFEVIETSKGDDKSNTIDEESFPEPTYDKTKNLAVVLDSIDYLKSSIEFVDGYTILVYSGNSSEQAKIARGKVYAVLKEEKTTLRYEEPNFKVKTGQYYTRLEAQKNYVLLKERFPNAIIIPERIYINSIER